MTLSDIILEMELGGVDNADISDIVNLYNFGGLTLDMIDEELIKKGYDPVFSVNYDDYDDFEDDYLPMERNPHRKEWHDL